MKNRGFTLLELLVVISIIATLSSIVLASLNTSRAKARDAQRAYQMRQVIIALELYYDNHGSYPAISDQYSSMDTPQGWVDLMTALTNEGLIKAEFASADPNENSGNIFALTNIAHANLAATYHYCSVQDPLYKTADDYLRSYGYLRSPDGQSYKLRMQPENPSSTAFKTYNYIGWFITNLGSEDGCDVDFNFVCYLKGTNFTNN